MTHDEALTLRYAAGSDVGRHRSGNEDSAYATARLLAVADGMGGHAAGEVASAQAIAALEDLDTRLADEQPAEVDLADALTRAVAAAAERLDSQVADDPALTGMGTTVTAILWDGPRFGLAHIGDSRCYRLRGDTLAQLTHDHTMVQTLVDQGRLTPEVAERHPSRSVLVRALLAGVAAEPDVSVDTAEDGDIYLLCSDGLTDVVKADELHRILTRIPAGHTTPDDAVESLIDLANAGGGPDNITCVVAQVVPGTAED
ncbi:PP2C family protein-serine/threonine phosphatase [Saccharomonospora piscinae]|uniref:Protein phosphatase n=1 Tax=Saccharomonospora piscinae TaxID=687388 RepID=A0A1V8ZWY4_SACPI|nr:protein phosphatase 2C domain-containing protein [Saccharomonospora piscinae]OQO89286.1 protein phosphatase [Saccharomonospora piscinae]TLW90974.1 serine/threonine-protein phosphatase [Saccharomonospora piscinae]